ncbi:MAG: glycosyltransferase family 4 protein [Planctomycetes bacterium]|nr:glycosyltransferase family 4 protein [Planctomycetota bacterium]
MGRLRRARRGALAGARLSAPRVLVCGTVLAQGIGGVQRHNRELLPRLASKLEARGGRLAVLLGRDGLDFELPASIERIASGVPATPAAWRAWHESGALRSVLKRSSAHGGAFDLVHTAHLPAPRGLEVPFTLTLHDLKSVASPFVPLARRLVGRSILRSAVRRAAHVFCVSNTLAREMLAFTGADEARVSVAPNGCDHLPRFERAASNEPFLLFVGRLEPRKDVETLLRALALDPTLPRVVLAGAEQGDHGAKLRVLAQQLSVCERVNFAGPQSDSALARLYAECAAVVLPSLREGFDLPLVEALRAGAPALASDLPVHRELAGEAASYFASCNPTQLLSAWRSRASPSSPLLATWDDCASEMLSRWTKLVR